MQQIHLGATIDTCKKYQTKNTHLNTEELQDTTSLSHLFSATTCIPIYIHHIIIWNKITTIFSLPLLRSPQTFQLGSSRLDTMLPILFFPPLHYFSDSTNPFLLVTFTYTNPPLTDYVRLHLYIHIYFYALPRKSPSLYSCIIFTFSFFSSLSISLSLLLIALQVGRKLFLFHC